jgi:hypothetical protein
VTARRVLAPAEHHERREDRMNRKRALVARIRNLSPEERLEAWWRETAKSQAAFYRRLRELPLSHFSEKKHDALVVAPQTYRVARVA